MHERFNGTLQQRFHEEGAERTARINRIYLVKHLSLRGTTKTKQRQRYWGKDRGERELLAGSGDGRRGQKRKRQRAHQGGTIITIIIPVSIWRQNKNSYLPYCLCERISTSEKLLSAAAPQVPDIISGIRPDPRICGPQLESWRRAVKGSPPRDRSPAADPGKPPNDGPVRSPR